MDSKDTHAVVQLLLARIESNPEEFLDKGGKRWEPVLDAIAKYGTDEECEALTTALRPVRLEEAHVWALDELLNGTKRREEQERAAKEARVNNHAALLRNAAYSQAALATNTYLQNVSGQQAKEGGLSKMLKGLGL